MENNPTDKDLGAEKNFGKLTPEEQREASRKHTPPNHEQASINENLGKENARKLQEEQTKHIG